MSWAGVNVQGRYRTVLKQTAFAIRYTSMTLTEALSQDVEFLNDLLEQVGEIVKEENKTR